VLSFAGLAGLQPSTISKGDTLSRSDIQRRIHRSLAVIRYQCETLSQAGLYDSASLEELMQRLLNIDRNDQVTNLNFRSANFPGIDLRSPDGSVGYQVTLHATKAKFDETVRVINNEISSHSGRLDGLQDVYVVGLTCVKNTRIRQWSPATATSASPRIRAVEMKSLFDLALYTDELLADFDDELQSFVADWGRPLQTEAIAIEIFVSWIDRPALRDARDMESSWSAMEAAMQQLRKLLKQGVDDSGNPVVRPITTFQGPIKVKLNEIYDASHSISKALTTGRRGPTFPDANAVLEIDRLRAVIRTRVEELCHLANVDQPTW
jgi:hypothetical protein